MDRRIRKTKNAIITAFLELLEEKNDIDRISITDITKRADISRSTFYFHYNGTYELVDEICDSFTKEIYSIILKAHSERPTEDVKVRMYREILEYLYENRTQTKLLLMSPKGEEMVQKICDDLVQMLTVFYLSQRRQVSKEILAVSATMTTNGILAGIKHWVASDFSHTPQEMADLLYQAWKTAIDYFITTA